MKIIRIISILLIIAMSLGLFACKNEEQPADDGKEPVSDSGENTDGEDTDDADDTGADSDIPEPEPKDELFSDVAGKRIYLWSLTGIVMNAITEYSYDGEGRLVSVRHLDPYTFLPTEQLATAVCKYTYGEDGRLLSFNYYGYPVELEYGDGGTAVGCFEASGNKLKIEFAFFEDGGIKTETMTVEGSGGLLVTAYDERGRVVSEEDELSSVMSHSYGEELVTSVYSIEGKAISTTESKIGADCYPEYSEIISSNGTVSTSEWSFDEENRCTGYIYSTSGLYQKMSFGYTEGYLSEYEFLSGTDGNDLVLVTSGERELNDSGEVIYQSSTLVENGVKVRQDIRYDDGGLPISYSEYSYHENGEVENFLTEFYGSDGYVTKEEGLSYNSSGELVQKMIMEYDGAFVKERVEKYEDGVMFSDHDKLYEYDSLDRLIREEIEVFAEGVLTAKGVATYKYDEMGNLSEERYLHYDGNGKFISDEAARYEYDENGEVVKATVSTYDEKGNLIEITE